MSHCSDSFSQQINSSGKPFVTLAMCYKLPWPSSETECMILIKLDYFLKLEVFFVTSGHLKNNIYSRAWNVRNAHFWLTL